jgi:hypothetical protein
MTAMRTALALFATVLALAGCTAPLTGAACPCTEGYWCDEAFDLCRERGISGESDAAISGDPDAGDPDASTGRGSGADACSGCVPPDASTGGEPDAFGGGEPDAFGGGEPDAALFTPDASALDEP